MRLIRLVRAKVIVVMSISNLLLAAIGQNAKNALAVAGRYAYVTMFSA